MRGLQLAAFCAGLAKKEAFPKASLAWSKGQGRQWAGLDKPFHSLPSLTLTIRQRPWGAGLAQKAGWEEELSGR